MILQFYITEDFKIYKINDVLEDEFGHMYSIVKFINHHKRKNKKEIYLIVRLQSLEYKTKVFNIPVEMLLKYKNVGE